MMGEERQLACCCSHSSCTLWPGTHNGREALFHLRTDGACVDSIVSFSVSPSSDDVGRKYPTRAEDSLCRWPLESVCVERCLVYIWLLPIRHGNSNCPAPPLYSPSP
uniref:Uncharacterized protein n=1 Tax=Cacopsylla melanoneura TaxID=428564 RepID=A0A8D8VCQ9_9HEMI